MYFLTDEKLKIIFGWSPKSGCSHIKHIFFYLTNKDRNKNIHDHIHEELPKNIKKFTTIVIFRNPYKRIVSGFLNKYSYRGQFRHKWDKTYKLTFTNFVNKLTNFNWECIDWHHFSPQTDNFFDKKILLSKQLNVYDIENIDYNYIENLYNKKIDPTVLNHKFGHERKIYNQNFDSNVYDLHIDKYYEYNVNIEYFYNLDIQHKVHKFYLNDFLFCKEHSIEYKDIVYK